MTGSLSVNIQDCFCLGVDHGLRLKRKDLEEVLPFLRSHLQHISALLFMFIDLGISVIVDL